MKKLLCALALGLGLSTSAFAANVISVDQPSEFRTLWSTVCVGNLELDQTLNVEYRFGDADWAPLEMQANQIWQFRQEFADGSRPMSFALRFDADLSDDAVEVVEAAPAGNITRLKQRDCDKSHYLEFKMSTVRDGTIELISLN